MFTLIRGVDILKRPAREGERPWDTLKGTSLLCVPIHYIVAYVFSLDYRGEWDDLLKKGKTVQEYGPLSKVTLMEYKPVWPASGRDFCTLWHLKRIDESVVCFACEAVESCPEQKGLVRAELVIGGFVVKEISSDPPKCLVTYIARVDLKGSLPTRLVNRVTSTQPQGVAIIRDKLEARYQADRGASDSGEMPKIKTKGVKLWRELTAGSNESEAEKNHEAGPHRMAEARPEEMFSSQILRSRPGVCC
ncbi:steroidogenic acute regulatory protein, mitochondrial-like [Montipora capricornis]|uniref:steroidogenic acute regulatory protein, mitochondrial-like n=1 Tax=Montipora capricornis TaxID=246305 RepID=UPI0035F186A7